MDQMHPVPASDNVQGRGAMVVVLHPPGTQSVALALIRSWELAVPMAILLTLPVAEGGGTRKAWDAILKDLERSGLPVSRLVLAGVAGAQDAALQLAFSPAATGCAGVLALGDGLPALMVRSSPSGEGRPKLRLVWIADNPLSCAVALGKLLRCLRAAGVDARGGVLARPDPVVREGGVCIPPPAVMRLAGAYLAELVAVALGGARSRPALHGAGSANSTSPKPCRSETHD